MGTRAKNKNMQARTPGYSQRKIKIKRDYQKRGVFHVIVFFEIMELTLQSLILTHTIYSYKTGKSYRKEDREKTGTTKTSEKPSTASSRQTATWQQHMIADGAIQPNELRQL